MANLLSIKELSYRHNDRLIINNVDLVLDTGEVAGLIGPVGAGKSTLAHLICDLIKPDSGRITFKERLVSELSGNELFRNVSLVFQFPEKQIFRETVHLEIAYALHNLGFDNEETDRRVAKYTERLGLGRDILERPPLFLSGGEMRKVALASIFSIEPRLLILDEPFSWLDADGCNRLKELILEQRADGTSFILISHDLTDLKGLCSNVWFLEAGEIRIVPERTLIA